MPTSIVVIKSDSFLLKKAIILDENLPLFLSNSNCNLLADINAISTPEKNAENKRVIVAIDISIWVKILKLNLFQI